MKKTLHICNWERSKAVLSHEVHIQAGSKPENIHLSRHQTVWQWLRITKQHQHDENNGHSHIVFVWSQNCNMQSGLKFTGEDIFMAATFCHWDNVYVCKQSVCVYVYCCDVQGIKATAKAAYFCTNNLRENMKYGL